MKLWSWGQKPTIAGVPTDRVWTTVGWQEDRANHMKYYSNNPTQLSLEAKISIGKYFKLYDYLTYYK